MAAFWILVTVPAALIMLGLAVDIANLWVARVELENGLEAAALAAVKEWGDAGGGLTADARAVGVNYAASNFVRGQPLLIDDNLALNPSPLNPNANDSCLLQDGNLIFGAISSLGPPPANYDPVNPNPPFVFNAGIAPGCGLGNVLIVAQGKFADQPGEDASGTFRIFFNDTDGFSPSATLRIVQVVFNLNAGTDADAEFTTAPVIIPAGTIGFSNAASQSSFSTIPPSSGQLTVDFFDDPLNDGSNDGGFQEGDSFEFQVKISDLSTGTGQNDGDGIGRVAVGVSVTFDTDGDLTTLGDRETFTTSFVDTEAVDPPPGNGDEESQASLNGSGGSAFGVRAHASVNVPSVFSNLFGLTAVAYPLAANTTAVYDCSDGQPRLIKIINDSTHFICPGP